MAEETNVEPFNIDAGSDDEENDVEGNMKSVPIDNDEIGNTMPSIEEARSSIPHRQVMSPSQRKKLTLLGLVLLVIAALVATIIFLAVDLNEVKQTSQQTSTIGSDNIMDQSGHENELLNFLIENEISASKSFDNLNSPQSLALSFMAIEKMSPQMAWFYSDMNNNDMKQRIIERYVLILIYYQFNGENWTNQLFFLSAQDHCEWFNYRIISQIKSLKIGVTACNDEGRVVGLELVRNNLKNVLAVEIPDEIQQLRRLEILSFLDNDITGTLGSGLQNLQNLRWLILGYNRMNGPIPDWIGGLKSLVVLHLSDNLFEGELPTSLAYLVKLEFLSLNDNILSGNLDDLLKDMSSLTQVYLEDNKFSGSLEWAKNKELLIDLDVSKNSLDGEIPSFLLNHDELAVLDLHGNNFTGNLPDEIRDNDVLQILSVHSNQLDGSIPESISSLSKLSMLDLSFNQFTGIIPTFNAVLDLTLLLTSGNNFANQDFPDFSGHVGMIDLSMKGNNLKGPIPEWIGDLSSLRLLDLDANLLTGSIPTQIGQMEGMSFLLLNRNDLTGTMPTEFSKLSFLSVLLLDGNSITGNANAICDTIVEVREHFVADCNIGTNGEPAQFDCQCCTECCASGDAACNDKEWTNKADPIWEAYNVRFVNTFDFSDASAAFSKINDENP